MFRFQVFLLAGADAVLAGAGAAHGLGTLDEAGRKCLRFVGLVGAEQALHMEVAVADVADHDSGKAERVEIGAGGDDAFGEARDGHADIGDQDVRARPECAGGVVGVVAGLPEALTAGGGGLPVEAEAAMLGGEAFGEARGLFHAGLAEAVELEEKSRLEGQVEMRVAVDGVDLGRVHELDAGDAEAELNGFNDRLHGAVDGGKGAEDDADCLRQRVQAQGDFSDDAEGALGADEEARQVVAGAGFAGTRTGVEDAAVGENDGEGQNVFAHGAITDSRCAGGAGGGHAADGGVGAGIDEEGEAGVFKRLLQGEAADAGFDGGVQVVRADAEDAVHLPHVDGDAAAKGVHVALERGARAEWDDGKLMARAHFQDGADFLSGLRKTDQVRQRGRVGAFAVAVMLADGLGGGGAVAEKDAQIGQR